MRITTGLVLRRSSIYKEAAKLNLQEGVGANRIAERGSEFVGRKGKGVSC